MAAILANTSAYHTWVRDSETGKPCATRKAVDVTEDCPNAKRDGRPTILVYGRSERYGWFVRLQQAYAQAVLDVGICHIFYVDRLTVVANAQHPGHSFHAWAEYLGLSRQELKKLIEKNAPL